MQEYYSMELEEMQKPNYQKELEKISHPLNRIAKGLVFVANELHNIYSILNEIKENNSKK